MRAVVLSLASLVGLAGAAVLVIAVGLRLQLPVVRDGIRRLNRRVLNPRNLRTAGGLGTPWAVVHHVGRRSGTAYRTPVGAHPRGDGFLVVLPYGPSADWVQNVLAAGTARLAREGAEHVVIPRLVPRAEVADDLPAGDRLVTAILGIGTLLAFDPATFDPPPA